MGVAHTPSVHCLCCVLTRAVLSPCRFGQLRDVDVTGVEPLPRGGEAGATPEELVLRLRPDEPANFAHREELLAAAANLEAPYLRIPKILDTDTD